MVAFCRLKIVKKDLFEVLEMNFIRKINTATPKSVTNYAFAHSYMCMDLLMQYNEDSKKYKKKSLKNIKYNFNILYFYFLSQNWNCSY